MSILISQSKPTYPNKKSLKKRNKKQSKDDLDILTILEQLKKDLYYTHINLDYATNPVLIDSYIYEIQSLNMKYQYYIQICKEKGLIKEVFA